MLGKHPVGSSKGFFGIQALVNIISDMTSVNLFGGYFAGYFTSVQTKHFSTYFQHFRCCRCCHHRIAFGECNKFS